MKPCHAVTLASAGTGKTYQLSGRFVDLLLAGVAQEKILATTFTRKAAGEILERVLRRLMKAVDDPAERTAIAAGRAFGGEFDGPEASRLLVRLARGLQRFEVRTIDSFFVTLGHLFAADLDLAPGWTIADEHARAALEDEALTRVLAGADEEDFAALLRELQTDGGAKRSVLFSMKGVVDRARAIFLESEREAWLRVNTPPAPAAEELAGALAAIESCPLPTNKSGEPDSRWAKAHGLLLTRAREGRWKELLGNGIFGKHLSGDGEYYKKPIPEAYRVALEVLCAAAAHDLLARLAERNRRAHDLLGRHEQALAAIKRQRGIYAFEDLPRALAPAHGGGPGPLEAREGDLALRLDTRIDHLLLDEFQDTAPVQWRVLRSMAEEIAADGTGERSFFCVGDVKQSIYGWRSAEPRLLETLEGTLHIEPTGLQKSYRSSSVVLDSVGRVFAGIGATPALEGGDYKPLRLAARRFQERFEVQEAAWDLPGAVELREAPAPPEGVRENDGERDAKVTKLTLRRVAALAEAEPTATIAVLVRTRKRIPVLIDGLQRAGLRASGEGGNPLTDSAAVLHALSLFHLADHPSDSLAAFHLASSPLGEVLGERDLPQGGARLGAIVRRRLAELGYGPFCASLLEAVQGHADYGEWDRRRFRQLVDLAFAQEDRMGLRADRFCDLVRKMSVEDPSAALIKVMTLHGAKGLEFDAVLLCELDGSLARARGGFLYERPDPQGPVTFVSADPGKGVGRLYPELRELQEAQLAREAQEALSLLYVGMTRARHRLELLVRYRAEDKEPAASPAGILRSALGNGPAMDDGLLWRHEASSEAWLKKLAPASPARVLPPAPPFALAPARAPRLLPRRSPSAEEGGTVRRGTDVLASGSAPALRQGSLIHRWFEEVEWLEDFDPQQASLLEIGRAIEPDLERRRSALQLFERALEAPAIRAALQRPAGEATLWRERSFRVVMGEGAEAALWNGAFDRVVLHGAPGAWERAEVLDFKTDRVEGPGLEERAEHYRPQLERYREALAALIGLDPSLVAISLLFVHPGERFDL